MGTTWSIQVFRSGKLVYEQAFDSGCCRNLKIGRLPSAQVRLEDLRVARIHAVIEITGDEVSLIDMGSTAGTFVNGARIQKVKLQSGDQIGIGDSVLVVTAGVQTACPRAVAAVPASGGPGTQPPSFALPTTIANTANPAPATTSARPAFPINTASQLPTARSTPAVLSPPRFESGTGEDAAPLQRISRQHLRSAAVESRPHPGLPPEQQMNPANCVLELRLYWGEVLLAINHYKRPKRITIGETKRTDIFIASEGLPVEEFPLVRTIDNEWVLTFSNQMEGEVESGGQLRTLQAVRGSAQAQRDEHLDESYRVQLSQDSRAIVHWGGATMALRFVPPAELPRSPWLQNLDLHFLNVLALVLSASMAFVVTLMVYPYDTDALREDLFDKSNRFVGIITTPPPPPNIEKMTDIKVALDKKKDEIQQQKDKNASSSAKREVPGPTKTTLTARPREPSDEERRAKVTKQIKDMFGGGKQGSGGLLAGSGAGSLSGSLRNVIGTNGRASSGAGLAGLGIRGPGPLTGGGVGTSVGIAGIDTVGREPGGGYNPSLGRHEERAVVDVGTPEVGDPLAMGVIRRVIEENKGQIRYCYEHALQTQQSLEGRVTMTWIIGATGAVAAVKIKESTLENDEVESCIASRIKTWRFPAPAGGGTVEVNYPFIFRVR